MANKELNIIVKVTDQATKQLQAVSKDVESFAERNKATFQKMAVGGAAAFAGIVAGVKKTTDAYQAQERAEARLAQIARQVTGATDEQIQGYKDLASQLQSVGVVGDEVIISGQSQLASFTKNADVVALLTNDLADLAVATYGVDVSQDQAIQTANMLGKAMTGQLGAMTRAGILVSDEYAAAFDKANTEMERAEIISKIVADNYGGINEAMRNTSEGGMQAAINSWGDMQEVIGKQFAPILADISTKILSVADAVSQRVSRNPGLTKNLILVAGAVAGMVTVLGILGLALPPIIAGFGLLWAAITGPIGLVIVTIGLLATAIYMYRDDIILATKNLGDWIKKTRDDIVKFTEIMVDSVGQIRDGLKDFFVKRWEENGEIVMTGLRVLLAIFTGGMSEVVMRIYNNWETIKMHFQNGLNSVRDLSQNVMDGVQGIFTSIFDTITNAVDTAVNYVIDRVKAARDSVRSFASNAISSAGQGVSNALSSAGNFVSQAIPGFADGGRPKVNQLSIVGERGPELFVPGTSGTIVPNNQLGPSINLSFGNFNGAERGDAEYIARIVEQKVIGAYNNYFAGLA